MKRLMIIVLMFLALFSFSGCSGDYLQKDSPKQLQKELEIVTAERDELKQDISSHLKTILKFIIGGSIIGIGVFGALAAFGNIKGGMFGATGCILTLVLAIGVGEHIALISWIGLGILLFCLGLIGSHIWNERKSIGELVTTTEVVKKNLGEDLKEKIFGKKGEIRPIQSPRTSKIVKKQKEKVIKKAAKNKS